MTPALLLKYVDYNAETGKLFWKKKTSSQSRITIGEEAGFIHSTGYRHLCLFRTTYPIHRLVWMLEHGELPSENMDHKNHIRNDNCITNLRLANHAKNSKNAGLYSSNKSGHTGVFWNKRQQKWHSQIGVNRKRIHLGFFDDMKEAIAVRKTASIKHNFHENHGKQKI